VSFTTTSGHGRLAEDRIEAFAAKLLDAYAAAMLTTMIDIGHRTALFEALARGAATVDVLSDRAGLNERYVREWLGAVVTGGIADYDPVTRTYALPPNTRSASPARVRGTSRP
jgi:hypothetical protein